MLRIIEATVAVLIVISTLLVLMSRQEVQTGENKSELLRGMLDEVARNSELREKIVSDTDATTDAEGAVENALKGIIKNPKFDLRAVICDAYTEPCAAEEGFLENKEEIYTEERIITASLTKFTPKVVKIYMW